ncbi:2',3'-cyclic-nucleotide 2'-phosphodiesterase/5'- or 3'-nucleotidase, 5'-nucleotidase family [Geosmithia morbida]|uniref:2',3'-cyclic-nucleotide 2'-phosphodiesterase/5'-or 3'-nucleotidase, 5'-nucleotidase family n=1 Tax=Geosmithia morbida TaxID=1094350 RepID=A0A9P4Z1C3_9HYPO|nr:2',3'-cyclic-nucleotide 2'-phosphodiesterase/5'- or 3'-nucleotidase, 5'-nucleotidase family [Geosmithia morbida]KAF4125473.1 2',3'-cyclic-nucleotide 2'-phosphodiesterase/5'- or 3'-nucleotidase, 5'-nucleotidase family [Geosmithia morbida]
MAPRGEIPPNKTTTYRSNGQQDDAPSTTPPDLRIIHYNDVYHVDEASAEPVGGLARFITLCEEYKNVPDVPEPVTFFSGDAFNPSLESSVTKGRHMVPVLNAIGTDCACVGNHDFDFGIKQFENLTSKTTFPWLLANVLDPALGDDVPLGHAKRTHIMTSSTGVKIGIIGLGEREWLATINSLPPDLIYRSATETAKELVPQLREQGAEIVVCLSHMREPNDNKLAEQTDGLMDIILGGHDHYYSHSFIKGTHVLRSGSDFKQLSYIEARRREPRQDGKRTLWDFDIWRRDVTSAIAEHPPTRQLVGELTSKLQQSLSKPVGWTAVPLDARFETVRVREANIGNFVCDIMRQYHDADCTIMASGTIRGGQIYPPGVLRVKEIVSCFPFEDPVVLLRVTGQAIWDAIENSVSLYPALEGRFPQVSGIEFTFDPSLEPMKRVTALSIDGYTALLVKSEGGDAEEIIDEESGILISALLRQYFMGLRTVGQWKHLADRWVSMAAATGSLPPEAEKTSIDAANKAAKVQRDQEEASKSWTDFHQARLGLAMAPSPEDSDDEGDGDQPDKTGIDDSIDCELLLMRKFFARWAMRAKIRGGVCDAVQLDEFTVDWTRTIAPVVDGRIHMIEK